MHPTAKRFNLTRTEWDILSHRLEESDSIAEALTDHCEGERPASRFRSIDLYEAAEALRRGDDLDDHFLEAVHDVLADCIDGCTYFADIEDEVARGNLTKSQMDYRILKGESLARKVSAIIGRTVRICTD